MSLQRVWIPSPNVSDRGGSATRLIVCHTAEGSTSYQSLGSYFANSSCQASSHVGIDDTPGVVGEYVSADRKAWTQANANPYCIAAETCAFASWDRATWLAHPTMLNNTGDWVGEESKRSSIPLTLLNDAQAQDGHSKGVCAHVNLGSAGGGHWDCGTSFPWDIIMARAGGGQPTPPVPPGLNAGIVGMGATQVGYHLFAGDGGVFTFGDAPFYGSLGATSLNAPIVGGISRLDGSGYYMVASDGGIFTFGPGCPFLGSLGSTKLKAPVAAIVADPDGTGYWLVAQDGGVFSFDAPFYGSLGGQALNAPIVAAASVPGGYIMSAADGGVFTFGAASFFGSCGDVALTKPIVAMAAQPDGSGYYLVGGDGGVFTFGNAPMMGGMGDQKLNWPVVAMSADPDGCGYWEAAADGGIFSFDAPFYGSAAQ